MKSKHFWFGIRHPYTHFNFRIKHNNLYTSVRGSLITNNNSNSNLSPNLIIQRKAIDFHGKNSEPFWYIIWCGWVLF